MNLGEIRDEVKKNLGNRLDIENTRYNLWINQTQIELVSAFPFFENADKATTTMVVGQSEYALPSDCIAIYSVKDLTQKRRIRRTGFRRFDALDETISGDPTYYIRYGNYIQLYPVPSKANTMQLRYGKSVATMEGDNDNPTININWHEALVLGATVRGLRALKQYDEAVLWKNEFLAFVRSREAEWETEEWDEEFSLQLLR